MIKLFKNGALLLVFLFLGTIQLDAQLQNLRFGLDFSPTFSWLSTDNNKITRVGLNPGIKIRSIVEYQLMESYSVTSGIGLSINQGGGLTHDLGGALLTGALSDEQYKNLPDNVKLSYHLRYIEIPIGFRMRTREFGHSRYYFHLPIFTLGIRSKATGDIEGANLVATTKENFKEATNIFNVSYGFGLGVEYSLTSSTSFVAGLAYHQGIADITDDGGVTSDGKTEDSKATIGVLEVKLGLLF